MRNTKQYYNNMVQIGGAKYHCVQRAHILAVLPKTFEILPL